MYRTLMAGSSHVVSLSLLVQDWLRSWTCCWSTIRNGAGLRKDGKEGCSLRAFHSLGLAFTVVDMDARKPKPSGTDVHKQGGALPVMGATPDMAKGNAGVEPTDKAEKAIAAKHKALVPWAQDKARRKGRHKRTSQSSRHHRKRQTKTQGTATREWARMQRNVARHPK